MNHLEDAWTSTPSIYGIEGDTISNELQFFLTGGDGNNSSYSPSVIDALETGIPIFNYANTNNYCGVRVEDNFKSIFLSFGIESVNNLEDRMEILNRSLVWFEDINTGVTNNESESQCSFDLNIFPNPCKENLKIKLPDNCNNPVSISITNTSGNQVYSHKNWQTKGSQFISVNLKLDPGIYFININSTSYSKTKKLIIIPE